MTFQKGNNLGKGRPAGSKNQVGSKLREMVCNFLEDGFEEIKQEFNDLEPRYKLKFYIDLMQFGLPKLRSVDLSHELTAELGKMSDEDLNRVIEKIINTNE